MDTLLFSIKYLILIKVKYYNTFAPHCNNTFHSSIKMSSIKAGLSENSELVKQSQYQVRIDGNTKILIIGIWNKLNIGDKVLVKKEVGYNKYGPKFIEEAIVKDALNFDTYMIQKLTGKPFKRHISHLKII